MSDTIGQFKGSAIKANIEKPEAIFITGLSGLRTLGIIGVILYHMFPYDIKGGFLGVTLFFIITGYLLAIKSEESRRVQTFNIGRFYLRRIKRLYPQLIIVLLATCGLLKIVSERALMGIRPEIASILFGYNNIWQINQNASYFERIANSSAFTHMWSLSNELQVYLIWPFIFLLFIMLAKNYNARKAVMVIGILALATSFLMPALYNPEMDVTRIYYGTDTRLFSFLTGAFIGFSRTRYRRSRRIKDTRPYVGLFLGLLAVVIISYVFMDGQEAFTYMGGMFILNIIFAVILVMATDRRLPIGRFMDNPVFSFIGGISYEMYLWMYPVIYIFHALHLNTLPFAPVLMFIIIILLSKWLNSFVVILVKRKIDWKGNVMKKVVQAVVVGVAVLAIGLSAWGTGSIIAAPDKDTSEIEQMQQELAEHASIAAQQNENPVISNAGEVSDPSQEQTVTTTDTDTPQDTDISEEEDEAENEDTEDEEAPLLSDSSVTAVGDSVMLGAAPSLQSVIPGCVVDAVESRQVVNTLDVLRSLESQGKLGNIVILGIGTNGPFRESVGQEIIDFLGPDRKIYWVNVYGDSIQWVDDSNSMIKTLVDKNDNVTLIDWNREGPKHPEWFYNDGIHLRPEGQAGYADFVNGIIFG